MIKIKKEERPNNCFCCHSEKNTRQLKFTNKANISSYSLYLCKSCLKDLLEATLNELLEMKE